MERIDSVLWDEWVNSISPDKKENDAECSGIIEGIFVARKMDHAVLASLRLWVFRRLYAIWKYTRWSDVNFSSYMRVPKSKKGRVKLILPFELYEDISVLQGLPGLGCAVYLVVVDQYFGRRMDIT